MSLAAANEISSEAAVVAVLSELDSTLWQIIYLVSSFAPVGIVELLVPASIYSKKNSNWSTRV